MKVIASAGLYYNEDGNPFESFDIDADDSSWAEEEFSLPDVPNDLHIYGSCMVAIDEHRFLVAGGASLEHGASTGGELVQVFDRRTEAWERLVSHKSVVLVMMTSQMLHPTPCHVSETSAYNIW